MQVTEEMVSAARRQIPERWGRQNLREAIQAALDAAPWLGEQTCEPRITPDGLQGDGARDATGSLTTIEVNHPQPPPALRQPLTLAGASEIADHYGIPRATVNGWINRSDQTRMPPPIARLKAGNVYDLDAVQAWHRDWKTNPTIEANNGAR